MYLLHCIIIWRSCVLLLEAIVVKLSDEGEKRATLPFFFFDLFGNKRRERVFVVVVIHSAIARRVGANQIISIRVSCCLVFVFIVRPTETSC